MEMSGNASASDGPLSAVQNLNSIIKLDRPLPISLLSSYHSPSVVSLHTEFSLLI